MNENSRRSWRERTGTFTIRYDRRD